MGDLPPDLERLRTLETWLVLSLDRVREQIAAVERPAQPRRVPQPPAAAARSAGPRRAPTPDWGISSVGIGAPVVQVHRGDCFAGGKALRPVSAERARAELADGVQACGVCRPDNVLNKP
ncbi:DUF6233 domain-containing protein [Streptomyces sp. rh34]|uniref:DUF6233 domain-containing protein n=1 Tax=Streptomyces sp. rh34 TaxID=2034272 RepID=UPI000BF2409E|nr:DUF6233 domain-containing protein [Streptomyces sp. rh34]